MNGIRPPAESTRALKARPTCDLCGRPVERFDETYDDFTARVRYRAWCHGETEYVDVNEEVLRSGVAMTFARAFVGPRSLPEGASGNAAPEGAPCVGRPHEYGLPAPSQVSASADSSDLKGAVTYGCQENSTGEPE